MSLAYRAQKIYQLAWASVLSILWLGFPKCLYGYPINALDIPAINWLSCQHIWASHNMFGYLSFPNGCPNKLQRNPNDLRGHPNTIPSNPNNVYGCPIISLGNPFLCLGIPLISWGFPIISLGIPIIDMGIPISHVHYISKSHHQT